MMSEQKKKKKEKIQDDLILAGQYWSIMICYCLLLVTQFEQHSHDE